MYLKRLKVYKNPKKLDDHSSNKLYINSFNTVYGTKYFTGKS